MSARPAMLAGLSARPRRLELAGAATAVLEAGDGPPLVLLHGGIECGGAIWAPVVALPSPSAHHVVIPDLPGLGESEPARPARRRDVRCLVSAALLDYHLRRSDPCWSHTRSAAAWPPVSLTRARRAPGAARDLRGARSRGATGRRSGCARRRSGSLCGPPERNAERFDRWAFFDYDRARAGGAGVVRGLRCRTRWCRARRPPREARDARG